LFIANAKALRIIISVANIAAISASAGLGYRLFDFIVLKEPIIFSLDS